ncbi:hypothetical protein FOMPIDRAFT_1024245 [Fomitopsis schrenkii]|uniref:Uncharacterized protein n=1 Tax=Fomitopsis schrenkii TaxID=2126942 RepID=S8E3J5_FOMSC|nr:hypothetical protein FOMPIDRAFT_123660 [Fomitopsis schrenkii]EPS99382.1 hypothetical protein FOMPIDRAFT_1024245 [Fomitopsis schrenkii]
MFTHAAHPSAFSACWAFALPARSRRVLRCVTTQPVPARPLVRLPSLLPVPSAIHPPSRLPGRPFAVPLACLRMRSLAVPARWALANHARCWCMCCRQLAFARSLPPLARSPLAHSCARLLALTLGSSHARSPCS